MSIEQVVTTHVTRKISAGFETDCRIQVGNFDLAKPWVAHMVVRSVGVGPDGVRVCVSPASAVPARQVSQMRNGGRRLMGLNGVWTFGAPSSGAHDSSITNQCARLMMV